MSQKGIILIWLGFILFMVLFNWYLIVKKNTHPNYKVHTIIKITAVLILWILSDFNPLVVPYAFFSYGALFDIALNIVRGERVDYIGTQIDSARSDNWEVKLSTHNIPIAMIYLIEVILGLLSMDIYYVGWRGFISQVNGSYDWSKFLW